MKLPLNLLAGWLAACLAIALAALPGRADFDLQFFLASGFTPNETAIVNDALGHVEGMWETMLTGYQPGINVGALSISLSPVHLGENTLATAGPGGSVNQGGFTVAVSGSINVNVDQLTNFAHWQGVPGPPTFKPPTNLNYIDELLAHETGHVLGIGTLWFSNHVLDSSNSLHYIGQYGLAAYQAEFDASATFVPIENAGGAAGAHWDQRMRSSSEEGNPSDPWSLDPRVFVTDPFGHDRGLELMTGAIDPDWGEPFVSRFTIQSMRDMGYTVTEFEDFNGDGSVNLGDFDVLLAHMGETGLQIDSMRYGDVDGDRDVDLNDFRLWKDASGVPEPGAMALAALAALAGLSRRRRA